jgi:hypothetical protein
MFFFASSCSEIKTELLYYKKMISERNQNVTIAPGFSKDKTKLWKWTRTKAFGPNFSSTDRKCFVSIQNIRSFLEQKQQNESFDLERTLV